MKRTDDRDFNEGDLTGMLHGGKTYKKDVVERR